MSWIAAVDYRRGRLHGVPGYRCRDYGRVVALTETIVAGAVAEGAGPGLPAHLGAKRAVHSTIASLRRAVEEVEAVLEHAETDDAGNLFRRIRLDIETSRGERNDGNGFAAAETAISLIAFAASPRALAAMRIGEGLLVYRPPEGDYRLLLGAMEGSSVPADAEGNGTAPAEIAVAAEGVEFLSAACGSLRRVSLEGNDLKPRQPFFRLLDRCAATAFDDGELHRELRALLRSRRLYREADGDITLALCHRRRNTQLRSAAE